MRGARRVVALCVVGALAVMLAGCGGTAPKAQSDAPIKIGAILSLTGTYAALGQSEKNALELDVAKINEAGGINGRPIDVVIVDDATDEAKAVAAASKLIEQDKVVAIIGATGTGQSMAIRGDIDRAGIPQVSMAGGTAITKKFDSLVFQTPWSNTIVVPFVLDAMKTAGLTKVALISDTSGYGKDGREVILVDAPKVGVTLVADETFNPGDTDMTAQLTNIKNSDAQAILLWTAGKEATTIVKSARDLGVKLPMYGGSGQAKREFMEGAGAAAEGFIFGTGKSLMPENWGAGTDEYKIVNDFATRYEAKYGEAPDIFAGHAFDALAITVAALEKAGGDDPAALRDAIEQTKDLIGYGGNFTFSADNHNGLTAEDLALYRIESGEWVPAK